MAANLKRRCFRFFVMAAAKGKELLAGGVNSGTAFSFNNPKQSVMRTWTARADIRLCVTLCLSHIPSTTQ